jgi:hypothetical protein
MDGPPVWGFGIISAVLYVTGFGCLWRKKEMIDQIKRQTKAEG